MVLPPDIHQSQVLSLPAPVASCSSGSLLPVRTSPPSSNHDPVQSPPAAPFNSQIKSIIDFEPSTPSNVMRYGKPPSINPYINKYEFIDPLERDFVDAHQQDTGNWCAYIHPEGALYFHDPTHGVYTDSIWQKKEYRRIMDSCVDRVFDLMPSELWLNCKIKIELVVQLVWNQKTNARICRYYFVNHDEHLLFWLHKLPTVKLLCGVQGVEKLSHISAPSTEYNRRVLMACVSRICVEHQYWQVYY